MGRITEIIRSWPTAGDLASDLGMAGVKGTRLVRMWSYRGRIPPVRFPEIVSAAVERGLDHVTLKALHDANCGLPAKGSADRAMTAGAAE